MSEPLAFVLATGVVALMATIASVYRPPEPESPEVACIKARGQWEEGWGRVGWSGTCVFSEAKRSGA